MTNKKVEKVSLQILVENGTSAAGAALTKTYTYNNVAPEAAAEAILATGNALGGLIGHTMQGVYCTEKCLLSEAE